MADGSATVTLMESTQRMTVASIRSAIRLTQLSGVDRIEVGVREDAAGANTWNARRWPTVSGDWAVDLCDLEPLRDVLKELRAGYCQWHGDVTLDLYCYRQNGRGKYAEVELMGNVEMRVNAEGVVELGEVVA